MGRVARRLFAISCNTIICHAHSKRSAIVICKIGLAKWPSNSASTSVQLSA